MGIKLKKIGALFLIIIVLFCGCSISKKNHLNKYVIDVYYEPQELSIYGSQKLFYRNTEDTDLDEIYFHLYPNAYLKKDTAPMIGNLTDNYPEGFNPGQIDILNVSAEGKKVRWSITGSDKTILMIKLDKPLAKGGKTEINIDFQEKLPKAKTDYGSYDGISCFENWYPVLSVYDNEGWHKEPSSKLGESNFSEVSDYTVKINLPENQVVASTGKCIKEDKLEDSRKLVTIKADNVRDFTWISSSRFKIIEKKTGNLLIKSYFLEDEAEKGIEAVDAAARAFDFYSKTIGEYPYDIFSIVETPLYGGAMEYPMLTSIGYGYYKSEDSKVLESAVVHEFSHQWWYVTVGNNEYKEPWLDEALATYSEAMYFEKYYGKKALEDKVSASLKRVKSERSTGDSMDKFKDVNEYGIVVYLKGAYMLHEFRQKIGDENFMRILRNYYRQNQFKNASARDFLNAVRGVCGDEAVEFIKLRLKGID